MLMLARNKHIPSHRIFVTFLLHDRASIGWRDRVCKLWAPHVVSTMLVIIDREDILNKQDGAQRGCDGCVNDVQGLLLVEFNNDFCCSVSDDLALALRNLRILLLGVLCHNRGGLHLGWHVDCDSRMECASVDNNGEGRSEKIYYEQGLMDGVEKRWRSVEKILLRDLNVGEGKCASHPAFLLAR